jgi:hypothetical protein
LNELWPGVKRTDGVKRSANTLYQSAHLATALFTNFMAIGYIPVISLVFVQVEQCDHTDFEAFSDPPGLSPSSVP